MKKTETKSTVLLAHHLKALKLPTMLAECEKTAARCASDNVDHLGFLLQLCELELLERERKAAVRRLKAANFPNPKTLDSFDFSAQPSVNKVQISELMRCEYIDRRESILMISNPGTGKTHLATSLAMEACARGKKVRFWRVTELITTLMEAHEELVDQSRKPGFHHAGIVKCLHSHEPKLNHETHDIFFRIFRSLPGFYRLSWVLQARFNTICC